VDSPDPSEASGRTRRIPRGTGRQRLLDAAEELFASHGFTATTTRAIAERAGTSTGMVFYHFPSKEALLETLLAERSPHADLETILDQHSGDPRGALQELSRAIQDTIEKRGEVLRIMIHAEDPGTRALFRRYVDNAVRALARYLHVELGEHGLAHDQARAMAQTFLSAVLFAQLLLDQPAPTSHISDTIDLLLHGYI
jgi:AcrR family transcriptional regulator